MNIKPLADRVLILPAPAEEKTIGGIIIPDTAKEKPLQGKVVAVGNGTKDEAMEIAVGDQVLYGKYIRMALIIKLLSDKSCSAASEIGEESAELICENPHCITGVERGIKHLFKDGKCVYCDQKARKK